MARFYTSVSTSRGGIKTAQGNANGQEAHIRGWDSGVRIIARDEDGKDAFDIAVTGGSNNDGNVAVIGTVVDGVFTRPV